MVKSRIKGDVELGLRVQNQTIRYELDCKRKLSVMQIPKIDYPTYQAISIVVGMG